MITCSNCNHQNPEGSVQCESCYTPLPSSSPCSNCGALVQTNAVFCGQCGFNLQGKQDGSAQNQSNNLAIEDPNSDFFLEEDLIPTSINMNTFNSPWDTPEEEIENLSKIDDQQITFDEFMQLTSDDSTPDSSETEQDSTFGQIEDLSNGLDESDDLESWISSLQEESGKSPSEATEAVPQEIIEEIPNNFSTSDDLDFAAEPTKVSSPQADVSELGEPQFTETEPTVEMPTGGLPVEPILAKEAVLEPGQLVPPEETEREKVKSPANDLDINEFEAANLAATGGKPEIKTGEKGEVVASPWNQDSSQVSNQVSNQDSNEVSKPLSSSPTSASRDSAQTRLQLQRTVLYHLQTKTEIEVPLNLTLIRIGKPNQQVPPDVDVSGFPSAEVVSRVHAHIRVEGDAYFLEDMGSSNGTYINHSPLPAGNRHRLRSGDRFSLGKGDLMTFIFQLEGNI